MIIHDCFGSVLKSIKGGGMCFVCNHCGRPFALLNKDGISIQSRHGNKKDTNLISLKALKVMIREVESSKS